jgi:alpha-1,6-mannosyltransferase
MKICDLTQFYSPVSGGVKRYIEQKVAYLRRCRPDCRHILIVPGEKTEQQTDGPSTIHTIRSPLVSRTSRYRMLLNLSAVERILEEEKPSIIESGDPYQVAWKAVLSGQALGIPAVGFYHSHFPEAYLRSVAKYFGKMSLQITQDFSERYIRALYNRFHRTLVPSPALADLLTTWGVENVVKTDLGVDTRMFVPRGSSPAFEKERQTLRADLGLAPSTILLLYVGRLASEKNLPTLLAAFRLLEKEQPGRFALLAIGDGTQRSTLQKMKAESAQVHWVPYCGEAEKLAAYYRAADLFVHPGLLETFGLVTLESQACGTPVVGIRGSYMDRLNFSDPGHWAETNTPASLARAIQNMAARDLAALGESASRTVHARYSWDAVFSHIFATYEEVIRHPEPWP